MPQPPNASINIGELVSQTAATALAGRGINLNNALSTRPSVDAAGREIVWREVRSNVDHRKGKHVFYRQHLLNRGTDAEIYGSEVGVHFSASGLIWSISGHQFASVTPTNQITFTAAEAAGRARARLVRDIAFRPEVAASESQRAWRVANSQLRVAWDGGAFRYVWFTYTRDDQGNDYNVVIDAEDERILAFGDGALRSNCYPSGPWSAIAAVGVPVRTDLSNAGVRCSVIANSASDRPWPFTHEAFNVLGTNISILQETATAAFKCDPGANRAYTIVPLMADGGTVTYRNRSDQPEWRGSAAGDALFNTTETLAAFSTLGRSGWNGSNSDANVVLDSSAEGTDNAYFRMTGNGDPTFPPTPWLGISPSSAFYNMASGLDVIAHEWGHGVISTSANFPCITANTLPCQLHEGWADVIGNTVEKLRQPAGSGVEQSSDWTIHEDNGLGGYHRGALNDGDTGHTWTRLDGTSIIVNQAVHRQDDPTN